MNHPKRIALFGGSFDPVHLGHLEIARSAVDQLRLDEVRFIPCRISPHKTAEPPASSQARLEMLRLALADHSWAKIDDTELEEPPPSYSYKTAARVRKEEPNARLFWLLGTDQWEALPRWKHPEELAAMLEFIVFCRDHEPSARPGWRMTVIHGAHPESSTAIRQAVREGRIPGDWLPAEVAKFIEQEKLYRS